MFVETSTTQLEIIHERIGGNVDLYGLVIPELVDPCVLEGDDDEGVTAVFCGLVQLEIVPQRFVDGLRAGADNESGVIWDFRVYDGPCGRGEHLVVLRFVSSVGVYDSPEVVIVVGIIIRYVE